ncbi:MAG: ABC-F family ATP-binding cassette domain-containing protein [Clostridia bacterium]|nr:ABC-F family ATP-binding cassette domain-containing protein [Clostridia bacterium]
MLQIKHLTVTHTKDLSLLIADLSFSLRHGERLALIGEEGNGKSTLLRLIAGDPYMPDYAETEGSIFCSVKTGYLPQALEEKDREKTAYEFFCEEESFFDLSPKELGELTSRLSLPGDCVYSDQVMKSFSGGERVKLQILRLMMGKPQLLLLDEPSNDLDLSTVRWLTDFLCTCGLSVLFVSHDETLLRKAATSVLLMERLRRRTVPRTAVHRMDYDTFVKTRASQFAHQEQVARKEREEFDAKIRRFDQIRSRVEHEQNTISRGDPAGGRLLKKKMHAVMSMGRRFEREKEEMTDMPEQEEAIFAKLTCEALPASKVVLDLSLDALAIGERVLSRNIRLMLRGQDKLCITGRNGVGKSTLLRHIASILKDRKDIRVFYMPQDPDDLLPPERTPVDFLSVTGEKEENVSICVALGSLKFTADEMNHPCRFLSGGQKAKLMFLKMAMEQPNVLLLDEPTRNLSPLSGPVVRGLFSAYPGCILAVSHDQSFIREVCSEVRDLTISGFYNA